MICSTKHALFFFPLIVEDFLLLCLDLLRLELINDLLLLLATLSVLQVVHVELMLQIVDVCELLHVDAVEPFELSLQALVFLLVLWLYVLDTF
jgi:hypothetical protein